MDIRIEREKKEGTNYFDNYAREQLHKYFESYRFIESVKVFFRAKKHELKKVKLQMRLKGKDIFAEATGARHDIALDNAIDKIHGQLEKYKSKRYRKAS